MGWKTSNPHPSTGKTAKIGPTHVDVYSTNSAGKRNQPHSQDFKVSYPSDGKIVHDINPPKKS